MHREPNLEESSKTSRLLSELDCVIDLSGVIREIVTRYERIRILESITGPSRATRVLRKEIRLMESKLKLVRYQYLAESVADFPSISQEEISG